MNKSVSYQKWLDNNPEKRKAQNVVYVAKRNKTLIPKPCEVCGLEKSEAHHENYSKPLEINWLCKKHHAEADKRRRLRELKKIIDNQLTKRNVEIFYDYKNKVKVFYLSKKHSLSRMRIYQIINKQKDI
jgi:hypothetical protein